jgi:hypothetical protein
MMASVPSMALGSPPEIEHFNALLGQLGSHLEAGKGRNGAHVDEHASRLGAFDHTAFAQHRLFHMGRIGQHRDDEIVPRRHILGRRARRRASCDQLLHLGFNDVVNLERVARFEQVLRHGLAHDAQSYKTDAHFSVPFNSVLTVLAISSEVSLKCTSSSS